jgi:hypothetical protein
MTEQSSITRAESARLQSLIERTTLEPWEFRNGHNREGDSCDLLMAEVGRASEDEEPEYAEVFFGQAELGEAQVQANWDFANESRTALPTALRQLQKAMETLQRRHIGGTASKEETAALLREYFGTEGK